MHLADSFPSLEDRADLVRRRSEPGSLGKSDEFRWHAYHYAWRRVFLHADHSPSDPYYDPAATGAAEAMYRQQTHRPMRRIAPAEEAAARGNHDLAARLRAQDREREELAAKIPPGGWEARCPEARAYVDCVMRQARAGMLAVEDRTRAMRGDRAALARVRAALGTSAAESAPAEIPAWVTE